MDNDNRMYFDTHIHYTSVAAAESVIANMTDGDISKAWEGNFPEMRMVLEFSPKGNDKKDENGNYIFPAWPNIFVPNMNRFFGNDTNNPEWTDWESFIKSDGINFGPDDPGWEDQQYDLLTGGFRMSYLLGLINEDGSNHGFIAVCYGPTLQGPDLADVFAIASLRGTHVENQWISDPDDFTTLLRYNNGEGYEDIIDSYDDWLNFNPHGTGSVVCPKSRSCPDCGY